MNIEPDSTTWQIPPAWAAIACPDDAQRHRRRWRTAQQERLYGSPDQSCAGEASASRPSMPGASSVVISSATVFWASTPVATSQSHTARPARVAELCVGSHGVFRPKGRARRRTFSPQPSVRSRTNRRPRRSPPIAPGPGTRRSSSWIVTVPEFVQNPGCLSRSGVEAADGETPECER